MKGPIFRHPKKCTPPPQANQHLFGTIDHRCCSFRTTVDL